MAWIWTKRCGFQQPEQALRSCLELSSCQVGQLPAVKVRWQCVQDKCVGMEDKLQRDELANSHCFLCTTPVRPDQSHKQSHQQKKSVGQGVRVPYVMHVIYMMHDLGTVAWPHEHTWIYERLPTQATGVTVDDTFNPLPSWPLVPFCSEAGRGHAYVYGVSGFMLARMCTVHGQPLLTQGSPPSTRLARCLSQGRRSPLLSGSTESRPGHCSRHLDLQLSPG